VLTLRPNMVLSGPVCNDSVVGGRELVLITVLNAGRRLASFFTILDEAGDRASSREQLARGLYGEMNLSWRPASSLTVCASSFENPGPLSVA
jgi:hypothetical protein